MKYLLFGTTDRYYHSTEPTGAYDFVSAHDSLSAAQEAGTAGDLRDGHVAAFDGERLTVVASIEWEPEPIEDLAAWQAAEDARYEAAMTEFSKQAAAFARMEPGPYMLHPMRGGRPLMRVWREVAETAAV